MRYYSIFLRLLFGLWALLFVVLAIPCFYFSHLLEKDLQQDAYDTAVNSLNSVEWVLSRHKFTGLAELDAWTEAYGKVTGQRVSYIVGDRLSADSNISFADLEGTESHSARPEVLGALGEGLSVKVRYSNTLKQHFIYAAKPTTSVYGAPRGVIRLAIPTSPLSEHITSARWGLLGAFVISLLVGGGLCLLIIGPLMGSINAMAVTAQEIGNGNYSARMYEVGGRELRPLVAAINDMAHNIQSHLADLKERNSRLEALFAALHEGVVVIDLNGHVLTANPAALGLFPALAGFKSNAAPMTLMEATMLPELQDAVEDLRAQERLASAAPGGGAGPREEPEAAAPQTLSLETDGGLHLEAALIVFGDRPEQRILAVFRDISEKERLERLRRDFVANVSHELKTPLTSIKGYTEALLDMESDGRSDGQAGDGDVAPRREFLEIIGKNAEHMNKIVQGLLALARAEHHVESAALENIDVAPLLREAVQNKLLAAKARDLDLQLSARALACEAAAGRGLRDGLSEVFHNILDNALKYADKGTAIDIDLELTPAEVIISIKNLGPVIPKDLQSRVFERFYRLDRDGNPHKSGSAGLGLAICKRTVMGFGGRIWVESPAAGGAGRGAVFYVALRMGNAGQRC